MPVLLLHSNWFKSREFRNIHRGLSYTAETISICKHQFELKMVAASVIPLQERKSFHLILLTHVNVNLKIELFLLQWIWLYFLL